MAAITPKYTNEIPHLNSSRVNSIFNSYVNNKVVIRTKEIKKELAPYMNMEKALKNGFREVVNASGKVVNSTENKPETVKLTESEISEYKQKLSEFAGRRKELEEEHSVLSSARTRIGEPVAVSLTVLVERMLNELVVFAMNNAQISDRKLLDPGFFKQPGVEKLSTYPLFSRLPAWKAPLPEKVPRKQKGETPAAKPEKEEVLSCYIENFIKGLTKPRVLDEKGEPVRERVTKLDKKTKEEKQIEVEKRDKTGKYKDIRFGGPTKVFLNKLVLELLSSLSTLVQEHIMCQGIKTVQVNHVLEVLKPQLCENCTVRDQLTYTREKVEDPVVLKKQKDVKTQAGIAKKALERGTEEVHEEDPATKKKVIKFLELSPERRKQLEAVVQEGAKPAMPKESIPKVEQLVITKSLVYEGGFYGEISKMILSEVESHKKAAVSG